MRFLDSINSSHVLANTSLSIAVGGGEVENFKTLFSARGGMRQLRCNTHCAAVGVGRARDLNREITILPSPLPMAAEAAILDVPRIPTPSWNPRNALAR